MKILFDGVLMEMTPAEIAALPQAVAVLPPASRIISPLAFRRRLGASRGPLTMAAAQALAAGDPTLRVMMDDIAAAREIDLDDPELVAGIDAVVALGLLTKVQGVAVLKDVTP